MQIYQAKRMISLQAAVARDGAVVSRDPGLWPHQLRNLCGRCRFIRWRSARAAIAMPANFGTFHISSVCVWVCVSMWVCVWMHVSLSKTCAFRESILGGQKAKKTKLTTKFCLFFLLARSAACWYMLHLYTYIEHTSCPQSVKVLSHTHTLTYYPEAICGRAWKTFTASKLKLMRSFSKSGLNAHTGRILGIAQGENFEPRAELARGWQEDTMTTRAVFGHRYRYLCYFEILILHTHRHIFEIVSFS